MIEAITGVPWLNWDITGVGIPKVELSIIGIYRFDVNTGIPMGQLEHYRTSLVCMV